MTSPNEKDSELSPLEPEQIRADLEIDPKVEHELNVSADIMNAVIIDRKRIGVTGKVWLIKLAAKEGMNLLHNGIETSAKKGIAIKIDMAEPVLFAGKHAHTINEKILDIFYGGIHSIGIFTEFDNKQFLDAENLAKKDGEGEKIMEAPKVQEMPEAPKSQEVQVVLGIREDLRAQVASKTQGQTVRDSLDTMEAPKIQEALEAGEGLENALKPRF